MKTFKIKEDIFKTETLFVIGEQEEVGDYLKKSFGIDADLDKLTSGSLFQKVGSKSADDFFRIIYLEKFDKNNIDSLVHELFHLTARICQDKGVPIVSNISTGENGDETAAYLLEFYVKKCLDKL